MSNSTLLLPTNSTAAGPLADDPFLDAVSPAAVAVLILSFVGVILDVPCIYWHANNGNLPATSLVAWIMLDNLFNFLNAAIWPTDDFSAWWHGNIYCDVLIKFDVGSTIAMPAALLCIMRSLAAALDTEKTTISPSHGEKRRRRVLEIALCIGAPIYLMLAHFMVQDRRYYILAIAGCTPSFDSTWAAIPFVYIWPPIFCVIASYYAVLVIYRLHKYRRDFAAILQSSSSGLSTSRFLRLLGVSGVLLIVYLPLQAFVLQRNTRFRLADFDLARIHDPKTWQTIVLVPSFGAVTFDRWIRISGAFVVFACFGLGRDAKTLYRKWLVAVGFGRPFPSLKDHTGRGRPATSSFSDTSPRGSSFSDKAHLLLAKLSIPGRRSTSSSSSDGSVSPTSPQARNARPSPLEQKVLQMATVSQTSQQTVWPGHYPAGAVAASGKGDETTLRGGGKTTFWTRLEQFVGQCGPSPNYTMRTRKKLAGARRYGTSEVAVRRANRQREYEEHVVGRLA